MKGIISAAAETNFANRLLDTNDFLNKGVISKFHTAVEAGFLLDLYDSDKVVGLVDDLTYEFELKDSIFPYAVHI